MGFKKENCKIIDNGKKEDLYFLHGFTTNKESEELIALGYSDFDTDYNMIFCDARGHGTRKEGLRRTDWQGTIDDYNELIKERGNDATLIGTSMGGAMALSLGLINPKIKKVFGISAPNGKEMFEKNKDYYEKRYGMKYDESMFQELVQSLPYNHTKCSKQNKEKFYLIHAQTDPLVPFHEMEMNQKELCLPNENVLAYSPDEIKNMTIFGLESAHMEPSFTLKTHNFIKNKLKK